MKPAQSVPFTVARGLAAPLPGVPYSAFASTSAMMTSATIQNSAPLIGLAKGMWLAEPMKRASGSRSRRWCERRGRPRAPAGAAAGLAGLPAPVSMAFWMTILFFGQITNQTLAHMTLPRMPPNRMTVAPGSASRSAHPVVQEVEPAREERDHRAPAEPPERARQELLLGPDPYRRLRLGEERDLHEIEVVEKTDPGDAREEVNPSQQEKPPVSARSSLIVTSPPRISCTSTEPRVAPQSSSPPRRRRHPRHRRRNRRRRQIVVVVVVVTRRRRDPRRPRRHPPRRRPGCALRYPRPRVQGRLSSQAIVVLL